MTSVLPTSWAEAYERLAELIVCEATAQEWVREALERTWGVLDPLDLERPRRGLALQRVTCVLIRLEEEPGDLAFFVDQRAVFAAAFAHCFKINCDGPPWRVSPYENLPTHAEWLSSADF